MAHDQLFAKITPDKIGAFYVAVKKSGPEGLLKNPLTSLLLKLAKIKPEQFEAALPQIIAPVEDVAKSHATVLRILREHATTETLAPMLNSYEALGANLPEVGHVHHLQRHLLSRVHTDRGGQHTTASELSGALDILKDENCRAAYQAAQRKDGILMDALFVQESGHPRPPLHAPKAGQLLLAGPADATKHASFLKNMTKGKQAGLAFGAVAVIGLGAYFLLHSRSKTNEQDKIDRWGEATTKAMGPVR